MYFYEKYLKDLGEKKYRIDQVHQAVYRDFVDSFDKVSTLPKDLRVQMTKDISFSPLEVLSEQVSKKDGTLKVLFKTEDDNKIESVLMRHVRDRNTVCISSQVGCAMNCTFCSTGKMGFTRNLTGDEMIAQVLYFCRKMSVSGSRVTNVVFMGMGEPLNNYENVMSAIDVINDDLKIAIGSRHITISTCGIVGKIKTFLKEKRQINLAISLHAPNDKLRSRLMPVNNTSPIGELMKVLDEYVKVTNRRIFYEYVMLEGVNDNLECAQELGRLLQGKLAHVNLIPFNSSNKNEYKCSSEESMREFQKILLSYGVVSTVRVSLGAEIDGACGQLAVSNEQ